MAVRVFFSGASHVLSNHPVSIVKNAILIVNEKCSFHSRLWMMDSWKSFLNSTLTHGRTGCPTLGRPSWTSDLPLVWLGPSECILTVAWGWIMLVCVVVADVNCVWNDTMLMMNETLHYGLSTVYLCLLLSDWCISRQLWWGHQVPAYQVELPNYAEKQEVVSVNMWLFNKTIVKKKK